MADAIYQSEIDARSTRCRAPIDAPAESTPVTILDWKAIAGRHRRATAIDLVVCLNLILEEALLFHPSALVTDLKPSFLLPSIAFSTHHLAPAHPEPADLATLKHSPVRSPSTRPSLPIPFPLLDLDCPLLPLPSLSPIFKQHCGPPLRPGRNNR